jgi:FHS family L-fucose permease-like MFS transporter
MITDQATPKRGMFTLANGQNVAFTFALVSCLFLLWGFCNGMIDVMDKHFQQALHLTLAQSANVQWAHYLGYFLMALPAGWLATKLGYRGGIITGLLMVAIGGIWFIPATHIGQFWAFLTGVCFIAAGLTFLETIANPYTTVLGETRYAATRINLAQSCNGIGWIFGPIAGSMFFYGKDASGGSTGSQTLWIPYFGVAIVVIILAIIFAFAPVPDIKTEDDYQLDEDTKDSSNAPPAPGSVLSYAAPAPKHSIWEHPHFIMAVAAQFFYVAAQSGIFAYLINYMTKETPAVSDSLRSSVNSMLQTFHLSKDDSTELDLQGIRHFTDAFGSILASVGFVFFLVGRFTGAALLRRVRAHSLLGCYALINIVICGLIVAHLGWISVAAVFASYFFMSIMFPTIFALGIFGLGVRAKKASGFIVMAIMGGALLPKVMGALMDKHGISFGYLVPMACFAVVAFYGFAWPKLSGFESMQSKVDLGGH